MHVSLPVDYLPLLRFERPRLENLSTPAEEGRLPCQPVAGSVLLFSQDMPHEGSEVSAGLKFTMRTEAMYHPLEPKSARKLLGKQPRLPPTPSPPQQPQPVPADCTAPTMYGDAQCSAPMKVGKVRAVLSPELLSYLASETFVLEETGPGFTRCVDYPNVLGHVYHEGYFHGMRDPARVWSINPRTGANFHKPAAGVRLRAFLELVRRKHSAQIEAALEGVAVAGRNRSAEIVLWLIRCGYWL
jgi:hypothetical protein